MTLQELRFIVALAQTKHFGKAAKVLHVSQPTLSIAIRKLERELGVDMFERNKNEVQITHLGKDVLERAKRVLSEVEGIKQAVKFDKNQLIGTFKLGAIYTIGPYLLPSLITELHKMAPQMAVEIHEDYTRNLQEQLSAGDLDAIIISLPFSIPGVVTRPIYKEPFVVLMPTNHPLAALQSINEKSLSNYNVLMLGEGHCFRDQVVSSCPTCFTSSQARSGISWKTVAGSSLETIRHMIAANMGLTILPITATNSDPYMGNLLTTRPLKGVKPGRTVALAWRKTFPRTQAIEVLLRALAKCKLAGVNR